MTIREATAGDEPFLWEMLAAAVSADPPWTVPQARSHPPIAHYLQGWPRSGDRGVVAVASDRGEVDEPVGAAWLRFFTADDPGYGFVDGDTPELTIACRAPWRGRGVGRRLLETLLEQAVQAGIAEVSLSVDPGNTLARALYGATGFEAVGRDDGGSVTMLWSNRTG